MNITEAGNKYLKPLVSLIKGEHNKQTFENCTVPPYPGMGLL